MMCPYYIQKKFFVCFINIHNVIIIVIMKSEIEKKNLIMSWVIKKI